MTIVTATRQQCVLEIGQKIFRLYFRKTTNSDIFQTRKSNCVRFRNHFWLQYRVLQVLFPSSCAFQVVLDAFLYQEPQEMGQILSVEFKSENSALKIPNERIFLDESKFYA